MARRRARIGVVGFVVVVAAIAVVPVVTGAASQGPDGGTDETIGASNVTADTVLLTVDVEADGTATWTIDYLVELDDANTTDAFEALATDVRRDETTYTGPFTDRMRRTAASAANRTGRSMAVRNVSVDTDTQDLGRSYGVVRYRFTWTGFAAVNDTTIRVGDALAGFYLDADSRLTVSWPDAYGPTSVSPAATDTGERSVTWAGPLEFGADGPRVTLASDDATPGTAGDDTTPGSTATGGSPLVFAAVAAVLVTVGLVAVARWRRAKTPGRPPATAGSPNAEAGETDNEPLTDLLSNEERVLKLLDDEGGRLKQQTVSERLDWTDAKTSQVVTQLREDGDVDVFRLGRENVLTLPDEDDI